MEKRATAFLKGLVFCVAGLLSFSGVTIAQEAFTDITVSTGKTFEVKKIEYGANPYMDEGHVFQWVPDGFFNASFIQTANGDKANTDVNYLQFEVTNAGTMYVGVTPLDGNVPSWLSEVNGFTKTDYVFYVTDRDFFLYSKAVTAGETVTLGGARLGEGFPGDPNGYIVVSDDGEDKPATQRATSIIAPDEFVVFGDGPTTLHESAAANWVRNTGENGNFYANMGVGSFAQAGFFWDEKGIDLTQNVESEDIVFVRFRVPNSFSVQFTFWDSFIPTNVSFEDLQFGVGFQIQPWYQDGEWHELAIPLPRSTWAAHDSAKIDKALDGSALPAEAQYDSLQKQWNYLSAWNGERAVGPGDALFQNFTWDHLGRIGIAENGGGGGNVEIDYIVIGKDLDAALAASRKNPTSAAPELTLTTAEQTVSASWAHDETSDIGAYELYVSGAPITDFLDPSASFVGYFLPGRDDLTFSQDVFSPHPSLSEFEFHFMLRPLNESSFATSEGPSSTPSIKAAGSSIPFLYFLPEDNEITLLGNIGAGVASDEGFDPNLPYWEIGVDDVPAGDYSGKIKMAYGTSDGTVFYLYAEFLDDDILAGGGNPAEMMGTTVFPTEATAPGDQGTFIHNSFDGTEWEDTETEWNVYLKDQLQIYFGTYGVDFVTGTTNGRRTRGSNPDYFLSLQPFVKATGDTDYAGVLRRLWLQDADGTTSYYNNEHNFLGTAFETVKDEAGNRIGWKVLVAMDALDFLAGDAAEVDAVFDAPGDDEIKFIPLSFNAIDKDSGDPGNWWEIPTFVVNTSTKPGAGFFEGDNTVAPVSSVAIVGRNVTTDIQEGRLNSPYEFRLSQNFPNPFNPSTVINFAIPQTANVSLEIFNVLGERVATILNGQRFAQGQHSVNFDARNLASGVYLYRLRAGDRVTSRKMTLIK